MLTFATAIVSHGYQPKLRGWHERVLRRVNPLQPQRTLEQRSAIGGFAGNRRGFFRRPFVGRNLPSKTSRKIKKRERMPLNRRRAASPPSARWQHRAIERSPTVDCCRCGRTISRFIRALYKYRDGSEPASLRPVGVSYPAFIGRRSQVGRSSRSVCGETRAKRRAMTE